MRFLLIGLLFALQGFLAPLVAPWPPPDLLLLAALLLLGRRPLWQAVALAYLLGLAQDVAGGGVPGMHALALAAGVFVAGGVVPGGGLELSRAGLGWQLLALLAAFVGKWVVLIVLLGYLGQAASVVEAARVGLLEALLTVAGLTLLRPLVYRALRRGGRRLYL